MILGRRDAVRMLTVLGAATAVGCGGGDELTCTDTSSLSPAELAGRETQNYSDRASSGDKCTGCRFFTPGSTGNCGECEVIMGPIHPDGYCDLFQVAV